MNGHQHLLPLAPAQLAALPEKGESAQPGQRAPDAFFTHLTFIVGAHRDGGADDTEIIRGLERALTAARDRERDGA